MYLWYCIAFVIIEWKWPSKFEQVLSDPEHCYCVILNAHDGAAFPEDTESKNASSNLLNTGSNQEKPPKVLCPQIYQNSLSLRIQHLVNSPCVSNYRSILILSQIISPPTPSSQPIKILSYLICSLTLHHLNHNYPPFNSMYFLNTCATL